MEEPVEITMNLSVADLEGILKVLLDLQKDQFVEIGKRSQADMAYEIDLLQKKINKYQKILAIKIAEKQ